MDLLDLETRVFSRVNNKVKSALRSKYPDLNCVDTDKQEANPKYPKVYIHELESPEIGSDLEGIDINGVLSSFQITCFSNSTQDVNKEVMNEVIKVMKSMRYKVIGLPHNENDNGLYIRIARFRRPIGNGDVL